MVLVEFELSIFLHPFFEGLHSLSRFLTPIIKADDHAPEVAHHLNRGWDIPFRKGDVGNKPYHRCNELSAYKQYLFWPEHPLIHHQSPDLLTEP